MKKTLIALLAMHCLIGCAHSQKAEPQKGDSDTVETEAQQQDDEKDDDSPYAEFIVGDDGPYLNMTNPYSVGYEMGYDLVEVEAGTFTMGATPEMRNPFDSEKPAHKVTLTKNYYIGKTEVTQRMWVAIMGSNPSEWKNRSLKDDLPVERVTWDQVQTFIKKLNAASGKKFRLPTEAEWEFAARGGNQSKHYQYSGSNNIDEVAWYDWGEDNYDGTFYMFENVGEKQPNELGIYDMSGNVSEWCQDWFGPYSSEPQVDPQGPAEGERRVYRTGMRISQRDGGYQSVGGTECSGMGFRLALTK